MCSTDVFLGVLAILFPPLPVWVKCGICSAESLINILLCMLGFFPGLLHAWYVIAKYPEPAWEYETVADSEQGSRRVTYVFVHDGGIQCEHSRPDAHTQNPRYTAASQPKPQAQPQATYGTMRAQGSAGYPAAPQEEGVTASGEQSRLVSAVHEAAPAAVAGPSSGALPQDGSVPPSYAEAVGDHKVQSRE